MLKRIVDSRWFALADLVFVSVSVIFWELEPQLGWRPLLLALIPWLIRALLGSAPFQRSPLDFVLVIFLLTAIVGIWAAYDPEDAQAKYWLLIGAVLLYYAFAGQPKQNLFLMAGFMSLVGVGIAFFFLFAHDWRVLPAKISFLNEFGLWWMDVRPTDPIYGVHPNDVGGVIAMTGPLMFVTGANIWRQKKVLLRIAVAILFSLVLVSLSLTTSRGAWLALIVTVGVWLLWSRVGRIRVSMFWKKVMFVVLAIVPVSLGAWILVSGSVDIPGLGNPSQEILEGTTRMELIRGGLDLVGDFPFTGGGLESFPGLFSHYIMGTPVYLTLFSHNIFIDSALEQGVLGSLMLGWILVGSMWILAGQILLNPKLPLHWAVLAGLQVIMLHGLVDNIVYYTLNAPLLLMLPGFAIAISKADSQPATKTQENFDNRRLYRGLTIATALVILVISLFHRPLLATWYANLGAVRMSKVELAGFPTGVWDDGSSMGRFAPAEEMFSRALQFDPDNRTSHHRLGLIALLRRDFPDAISHLENAYQVDQDHRGIRKALGYSYAWSGQYDQAIALLASFPEVRQQEMEAYIWVWITQGRDDLVDRGLKVKALLNSLYQGSSMTP